ncbi:hypothetical protein Pmani_017117 [Petrolisthes manimaculis]|uniref:Uncharacterized protein n=1 Tax=Petrolisthes manimaculis TaxID=1843537 RepID=A0AAE1PNQ6_9EUCA|nr:hypothetical protein Pmani_017117 [Petrolisthes manimaculis]
MLPKLEARRQRHRCSSLLTQGTHQGFLVSQGGVLIPVRNIQHSNTFTNDQSVTAAPSRTERRNRSVKTNDAVADNKAGMSRGYA